MDKYKKSFLNDLCAFLIEEKKHAEIRIHILNNHLQDKAWSFERNYLINEMGIAKNKINYMTYLINLVQEKIHQKNENSITKYEPEQLKM